MSDQSGRSGWAPPGDATPAEEPAPPAQDGGERTASFAREQTERLHRDDPPPPPPPPPPPGGWQAPPPPGGAPPQQGGWYGSGGWQPPPTPRRRTGVILAVVLGVLALVTVVGLAATVVIGNSVGGWSGVETGSGADEGPGEAAPEEAPAPEDVPADDLEAQSRAVLETINESEERMIAFQRSVASALGEDGSVGDAAADVAREAQEAGNDLTALRSDLRSLAGGEGDGFDGLRDVRDAYAGHMRAWIDYVDAVAGSPAIVAPDSSDAEPFWREIESSGDEFVDAMVTDLPTTLPAELEELADFIVERGFGGFGAPSGDVV